MYSLFYKTYPDSSDVRVRWDLSPLVITESGEPPPGLMAFCKTAVQSDVIVRLTLWHGNKGAHINRTG